MTKRGDGETFQQIGAMPLFKELERKAKPPTPIERRIVSAAVGSLDGQEDARSVLFQHSALCQTFLPYRDPGDDARSWERRNGTVHLKVIAGEAMHPEAKEFVAVGLPFGPKARLVLMHLNQLALRSHSPEIDVEGTLTRFVNHTLNLQGGGGGRTIRTVKEQLARLAASSIRLGVVKNGHAVTVNSQVISQFDIWFPKDDRQRILWPSTVRLSLDYWESLKAHAVPLDEAHIAALAHSAMSLDVYAWLAQRLHRIPHGKPAFVPWVTLFSQFGQTYTGKDAMRDFRKEFRRALRQVLTLYSAARIDDEAPRKARLVTRQGEDLPGWYSQQGTGLTLHHSPPIVPPRYLK